MSEPLKFGTNGCGSSEVGNDVEGSDSCVPEEQYIKLNVGGWLFYTTLSTLTKHDTMLKAMFSGRMETVRDDQGWVVIDRNGRYFGLILDFLRDSQLPLPDCKVDVEQILSEARYYLVQDLVTQCENWLNAHAVRRESCDPNISYVPTILSTVDAAKLISVEDKPVIKLLVNRHNNKYSYAPHSDDNLMKHLELFDRLAIKFHDRILFIKDLGMESTEVCVWQFFGKKTLRAEICCTSIVYATDKKHTKVEFNEAKIYEEAMSILRFENRGQCTKCGGDSCQPAPPTVVTTPTSEQ